MAPSSAASPVLLAWEAASPGKALLLPNFKVFASSDTNVPFQGAHHCSAVAAPDPESANRRKVLALFLTLGEIILIGTTFGVKFRKNPKHLPQ